MFTDKNMAYVIAAYGVTIFSLLGMVFSVAYSWRKAKKERENRLPQKKK